jgi:MFS family permease
VLFLVIGGVVADRLPRQLVMVGSAVNGIAAAFAFPAASALMPQTVPAELIQPANAINRLGMNAAMIAGAAAGGALVALVEPGWGLMLDAATFAVAAVLFAFVRVGRVVTTATRASGNPLRELRDGWREFTSHTWLWTVVLGFTLVNFAHAGAIGSFIAIPLGQMLAGPAALRWGTSNVLLASAAVTVVAVGGMLAARAVRRLPSEPASRQGSAVATLG